jgi:hypothetical protein
MATASYDATLLEAVEHMRILRAEAREIAEGLEQIAAKPGQLSHIAEAARRMAAELRAEYERTD